jgi:hypothetical protein
LFRLTFGNLFKSLSFLNDLLLGCWWEDFIVLGMCQEEFLDGFDGENEFRGTANDVTTNEHQDVLDTAKVSKQV